jgi:hypothetical protein
LTRVEAKRRLPVSLDGIVTYFDPSRGMMWMQDASSGIYVSIDGIRVPAGIKTGSHALLSGVSAPGGFAPIVLQAHLRNLGASRLPTPVRISEDAAFQGVAESRWVELEGLLQKLTNDDGQQVATLSWGAHEFEARFPISDVVPPEWLNRRIRVQGVSAPVFNSKGQLVGMKLYVPGRAQLRPVGSGPGGIDTQPGAKPRITPIDRLLQFSPGQEPGDRVRLRGRVEAASESGPTWIRDDSAAILIRDHNQVALAPGDVVDVTGYAIGGTVSPEFRHGIITKIGGGSPVRPIPVTPDEALSDGHNGQIVRIDGRLLNEFTEANEKVLLMEAGQSTFTVRGPDNLATYAPLSILSVTGICQVKGRLSHALVVPDTFEILTFSADSIHTVRPAPWLTQERAFQGLGTTVVVIFMGLCWVAALRRRVDHQTKIIAQKLKEV